MATEVWSHASYLTPAIQNQRLRCTLEKAMEVLAPHADKFDAIAFRGISGTIPGALLAYQMEKYMLPVRKGEGCHSANIVEGNAAVRSYLILDDCVGTGRTVRAIMDGVMNLTYGAAKCYGLYLYVPEWGMGSYHKHLTTLEQSDTLRDEYKKSFDAEKDRVAGKFNSYSIRHDRQFGEELK